MNDPRIDQLTEQIKQYNALLEALDTLSATFLTLETNPILESTVQVVTEVLGCTSAYISDWNEITGSVTVLAEYYSEEASALERDSDLGTTYFLDEDFQDDLAWLNKVDPYYVIHQTDEHVSAGERNHMKKYGIQTILGVGLHVGDRTLGLLELYESRERRDFSRDEIALALTISNQVASALHRTQLYQNLADYTRKLEILHAINFALSPDNSLEANLEAVIQGIFELYPKTSFCHIFLMEKGQLRFSMGADSNLRVLRTAEPHASGNTHQAFESCEIQILYNSDGKKKPSTKHLQNLASLPLHVGDRILGVIEIFLEGVREVRKEDIQIMRLLSDQISLGIQNSRLTARLADQNRELEDAVKERTQELEELTSIRHQFVTGISHELRTPVTNIKMYSQLVELQPERLNDYAPILQRETQRLEYIVEALLFTSRLERHEVNLQRKQLDLNKLLTLYVEDRELLAERKELKLVNEIDDQPLMVEVDPNLLLQVVGLLISNAVSYTPEGGTITISTSTTETDGKSCACFSVEDTGPGIEIDEREKVFDRFYRGKAGRDSFTPGTGLGLSIARELVDLHGGRIEIGEPESGSGARFTVKLPLERA